jgi:KUP system potassium uptake protein
MSEASVSSNDAHTERRAGTAFWGLTLGSIGVVYGDIGTSPLYAMREAVLASGATATASSEIILGILSLIIWALILVVTVKYVLILLRADNDGEGGTLSLMALAQSALGRGSIPVLLLGVIAAGLFYGDAMLTPALSVLSAVEGLKVAAPALEAYVVPLAALILVGLFAVQSKGTSTVAAFFGPITLVWFITLAIAGLWHISQNFTVLQAFNPVHGLWFLASHGLIGFLTLGAVFLAVTGAEALYADLGHFGRGTIQTAWLTVALPALTLNYLGQGALLL